MKILIAGSTGFIGSALVPFLKNAGHEVRRLVRRPSILNSEGLIDHHVKQEELIWNPEQESLNETELQQFDAIINLAGDNISTGRWTQHKKQKILESRIQATRTFADAILRMKQPPKIFINASAIGYYGTRGTTILTEKSSNGTGFLAHVCEKWESAAQPIESRDIRVVYARFGVILSPEGGTLAKMLMPFKCGLGAVIGSGSQYISWITRAEVLAILDHILKSEDLNGAINVVSPYPVTNLTFTKALGKVLSRPTFLKLPAGLIRLIFGEMGDELLLSSQRVAPVKLLASGYHFRQPELEQALEVILKSENTPLASSDP